MCGVWKRGCTRASALKNRPSPAIAKNTRGAASMLPFTELNEEIITNSETRTTPARPNRVCITSAATSGDLPDGVDRQNVEVSQVRQHVDADDRQRADDDGSRQVPLRDLSPRRRRRRRPRSRRKPRGR